MIFSHEKLKVYQKSLEFIEFSYKVLIEGSFISAHYQLDKASISWNIAEGMENLLTKTRTIIMI